MEKLRNKYNKFAISVRSLENYDKLMRILEDNGFIWRDGEAPTQYSGWSEWGKNTCIRLEFDRVIMYSEIDYFLKKDYVILSTNGFIQESGLKFRKTMTLSQIEKELGYNIKILEE